MTTPIRTALLVLCCSAAPLLVTVPALRADEPPKLDGTWTWSWQDPQGGTHRHVLEVEGVGKKLAARERFDDLPPVPVGALTLDGKNIQFTVVRGDKRADYRGVLDDPDTINGKVSIKQEGELNEYLWKAKRDKPPK